MKSKIYFLTTLLSMTACLFSFKVYQAKPWAVPDKYVQMKNPVASDAEILKDAKALWVKHCQSCHGKTGMGDGTKAAQLDTEMEDFTTDVVQKQPDGALFYKIQAGRDDMPSFKKKIPDEDEIWSLVCFMRSLK